MLTHSVIIALLLGSVVATKRCTVFVDIDNQLDVADVVPRLQQAFYLWNDQLGYDLLVPNLSLDGWKMIDWSNDGFVSVQNVLRGYEKLLVTNFRGEDPSPTDMCLNVLVTRLDWKFSGYVDVLSNVPSSMSGMCGNTPILSHDTDWVLKNSMVIAFNDVCSSSLEDYLMTKVLGGFAAAAGAVPDCCEDRECHSCFGPNNEHRCIVPDHPNIMHPHPCFESVNRLTFSKCSIDSIRHSYTLVSKCFVNFPPATTTTEPFSTTTESSTTTNATTTEPSLTTSGFNTTDETTTVEPTPTVPTSGTTEETTTGSTVTVSTPSTTVETTTVYTTTTIPLSTLGTTGFTTEVTTEVPTTTEVTTNTTEVATTPFPTTEATTTGSDDSGSGDNSTSGSGSGSGFDNP